jgi:hypothetical protein
VQKSRIMALSFPHFVAADAAFSWGPGRIASTEGRAAPKARPFRAKAADSRHVRFMLY